MGSGPFAGWASRWANRTPLLFIAAVLAYGFATGSSQAQDRQHNGDTWAFSRMERENVQRGVTYNHKNPRPDLVSADRSPSSYSVRGRKSPHLSFLFSQPSWKTGSVDLSLSPRSPLSLGNPAKYDFFLSRFGISNAYEARVAPALRNSPYYVNFGAGF